MTVNALTLYTELTKKQIVAYMKLVFGKNFNKKYNEFFVEKYINTRYYNYYENDIESTTRKKIMSELKDVEEKMIINNINDRELIHNMNVFFEYILYFDEVIPCKDLNKKIESIAKLRKKVLKKEDSDFEKEVLNQMTDYKNKKEKLLKSFESKDFYLKLTNYPNKINLFRVNLKHNIKFPKEFSDFAIQKAFNSGTIEEDKLMVEYYLVVVNILEDILKQDFRKQYILEFCEGILSKPKKFKALINIIDNTVIQEKVSIKIQYEDYAKNKDKIQELIRQGFKVSIVLDETFDVNSKSVETLKIFSYIIINKQLEKYDKIKSYKIQNIIEI